MQPVREASLTWAFSTGEAGGKFNRKTRNPKPYLEGQGDLVSRLLMGITGVTIWVMGVLNLLTKSP